ncbi:MAG: ribosome small subunit-dependent GTPase A, partial [Bacteroidota bacterium]
FPSMEGLVYRSTGSWYVVKDTEGRIWNARMKGVFKLDGITSTNPIAVGDVVSFVLENEGESSATITKIHDRRNYINRQSPRVKSQRHIVAANVDQSLMIATIKEPRTSQGFIDRFLVACEMYHVPAIVLFNKLDLYKEKELKKLEHLKSVYENVGYKVAGISLKDGFVSEEIVQLLKNKTTVISGHSGVGKSTFINCIFPEKNLRTQIISGWSGKGQHTTTFAEMFDLPHRAEDSAIAGKIIDTPGMKEFGLVDVERNELSGYFPEMRQRLNHCQFNNCLHVNEPDCAVKDAVVSGEIDEDRYVSYVNMLNPQNP